ncbi:MAG: hypothetical protein CFE26_13435 [Verrucomicrobiales bacterium VVV1]|nr:MAG: hypothetical protein CFE26_13435 [Verrucomicrobiales bacterium VVV1]
MTFCPFCGVRQDVNLRQIHFRDMGFIPSMACPECTTPLAMIEFDTEPKIQIERCPTCYGTFFNPGEVEALLDTQTNPLVWLDPEQLNQIAADFQQEREIFYRKCPVCFERMSHVNFGGHSGVILDRCGTHGVWLDGSKLRRLTEWWRAGGKLIYQQNEAKRVKQIYDEKKPAFSDLTPGTIQSLSDRPVTNVETGASLVWLASEVVAALASSVVD